MKRFRDDDLILFRSGESPVAEAIRAALADDPELARRYSELERLLDAADLVPEPEPIEGLEARIWRRVRPRLDAEPTPAPSWRPSLVTWRLAALATMGVLVLALAFALGRWSGPEVAPGEMARSVEPEAGFGSDARERVLLASVAGHLDASERLLTELVNRDDGATPDSERELAAALLSSNRLYRAAAARAGQRRIVRLLDQLEPVLLELANAPAGSSGGGDVRRLVESEDLLFKVRIVGGRLEPRALGPMPLLPTTQL